MTRKGEPEIGELRMKLTATFPPPPLELEAVLMSSNIPRNPVIMENRNMMSSAAGSIICER